jgi:hypothetical protein
VVVRELVVVVVVLTLVVVALEVVEEDPEVVLEPPAELEDEEPLPGPPGCWAPEKVEPMGPVLMFE